MGCWSPACTGTLCPWMPVEEAFPSLLQQLGWLLPQLLPSGPADSDPSSASISLLLCGRSRDVQGISPAISHAGKKYVHHFLSSTAPLAHTLTAAL